MESMGRGRGRGRPRPPQGHDEAVPSPSPGPVGRGRARAVAPLRQAEGQLVSPTLVGRMPHQEPEPPSPTVPLEHGEDEGAVEDLHIQYQAMYVHEAPPSVHSDSDRGADRGRTRGREGVRGAARGAARVHAELEVTDEQSGSLRGAQPQTPESPKEVLEEDVGKLADADVSPPSEPVAVETEVGAVPVPEKKEEKASVGGTEKPVSHGPGSTDASKRLRRQSDDDEVISRIGSKGEPVELKTNYLRLKLLEGHPGVVEYHVSIQPNEDRIGKRRKILGTEECAKKLGTVKSFDGMKLFLPQILPDDVTRIETTFEDVVYTVTVKFETVKLMKDAVVFFNVLLHKIMRIMEYQELRREYYDLNMITALNQHKLEIWPGLNLSSENQEGGLMICVDTCSRVLRQDTVYDYLSMVKGDPNMRTKFEEFIINKIVMTKYNYKCYKIDDVMWNMQPTSTFVYRNQEITFVDYLKSRHPIGDDVITDMNQPMLISKLKPRKNDKFAEEGRIAALVPQLCYVTGLSEEQKANFKVMTDLAASTRLVPAQRVTNLEAFIKRLLSNEKVKQTLGDWGLCIERDIIEVRGRRADGPNLVFNQRVELQKAPPDFGRESGKAVYEPVEVRNYVVLCTQRDADKAKRFMDTYKEVTGPLGIKMPQLGRIVTLRGMRPADFSDALKANCHPDNIHFVVIIMPMQRDDVYSAIKRYCVANVPIPSQCIVSKTLGNEKRLRSIVLKIALQINCKLGGSLWALRMPLKEEIMFIGVDAAHDPLKKDASVICLVASLNNECTKYFSKSAHSKVHMELGESLGPMTTEALTEYRKARGRFPNRIVVFRDGGSLGALSTIETTEMDQMRKAAEMCGDQLKNFTFALVTKRISQRFFAKAGRDKLENPPPGTIVDNVVTRRHLYDFYVVSQQVRQGTVNPTHFVVVDKNDPIRPDLIQKLAYVTCFMYYNWAGTVRVPAMVQYAHKLSALLIKHVKANPHKDIATTLYYL